MLTKFEKIKTNFYFSPFFTYKIFQIFIILYITHIQLIFHNFDFSENKVSTNFCPFFT